MTLIFLIDVSYSTFILSSLNDKLVSLFILVT